MKRVGLWIACTLFFLPLFFLSACTDEVCYFDYVSELRNNIFIAKTEDFSLRIYSVTKEQPYAADGIPKETNVRTEAYLIAPTGSETCTLQFTDGKREYCGEMSYDSVKGEYYFFCAFDVSAQSSLNCQIAYGEKMIELTANSVLSPTSLSPEKALQALLQAEPTLFSEMTDTYGFKGEIYLRLIYEDAPFYYVGVIGRNGEISAFLIHAETGKILAKRKS